MRAALARVLLSWLTISAILVAGLALAWTTGQADPWRWGWPLLIGMAGMGLATRRGAIRDGLGAAGAVLLFCTLAAGRWPQPIAATGLIAVAMGAAVGGRLLRDRRWAWAATALCPALALAWFHPPRPIESRPDRAALAVISGLPLFWRVGEVGPQARADAPIVAVLRRRFDVLPLDTPTDPLFARADRLLLAQPRGLRPRELVAIDGWVRRGGRAVVLADPLLRWPSDLPLGDRRRAPAVTLLAGLLDQWRLAVDPPLSLDERRIFLDDGRLMTVLAASTLRPLDGACRLFADGLAARCAVGKGEALVVGDADLIDDRLWLADPVRPLDPRQWTADTPRLIAGWLGADLPAGPGWLRDREALVAALRWALLAGLGWVAMGRVPLRRRNAAFRPPFDGPPIRGGTG